jgi:two-component system sensor histidine kinase KdpD
VRDQAEAARRRESLTAALYDLSREIAGASGLDNVLAAVVRQVGRILSAHVIVFLPEDDRLKPCAVHPADIVPTERERGSATWAWEHNEVAGRGTGTLPGEQWRYLPLRTSHGAIGVMALMFEDAGDPARLDHHRLVDSLAHQAAVAIESARFARESEEAKLLGERERLQAILLSSISHDLRTPLASILGSVTTLRDHDAHYEESTREELLATIQEEGERLNRFVGNLLDTTRLESGKLKLNRDWIDVSDLLGAAVSQVARSIGQHPIEWDIQPGIPLVHVDFVLITQVFVNLLDNAAKYSPAGSPIRIEAFQDDHACIISITDRGIGIAPEDQEQIFDKFYRVERGDRQIAGTGLGLSICRGIITEHGGSIAVTSPGPDGTGTVLRVTIPADQLPPEMEPSEQMP